jgi:hypothetical protein
MLNAVWVAVIAAAAGWLVLVTAAVFVLLRMSRLISTTSVTVATLRERNDALIDRAHAALDATAGQLSRTDEITASMDEVAAGMADLTGRVTAFAPLARLAAVSAGTRLARVPALLYGVRHAAEMRALAGERSPGQLASDPRGIPGGRPRGGQGTGAAR